VYISDRTEYPFFRLIYPGIGPLEEVDIVFRDQLRGSTVIVPGKRKDSSVEYLRRVYARTVRQ
jgi:hypothetical protein